MSDWVSVKERLPEDHTRVIAYFPATQKVIEAWYGSAHTGFSLDYGRGWEPEGEVTHWMPLPEPPKPEPPLKRRRRHERNRRHS